MPLSDSEDPDMNGSSRDPPGSTGSRSILGIVKEKLTSERSKMILKTYYLPITIFLVLSLLIHRKLLFTDGMIVNGDMVRPPSLGRYFGYFYPMWNEFDSVTVLSRLPQLLFYAPFFALSFLFGLDTAGMVMLVLIFIKALAGISMYFSIRYLLKKTFNLEDDEIKGLKIWAACLLPALLYMWSSYGIYHAFHPAIMAAYALGPLMFLTLVKGINERNPKMLILAGFLWSVSCGAVHWTIYGPLLLLGYIFYSVVRRLIAIIIRKKSRAENDRNKRSDSKKYFITHLSSLFILLVSFAGFSAYWLIPGFFMGGTGRYSGTMDASSLEMSYARSSIMDIFTRYSSHAVESDIYMSQSAFANGAGFEGIITIMGIFVFLVAISAIFMKPRNRYVQFFFIFGSLIVLLTVLVHYFPSTGNWLINNAPFSGIYGWSLRTPKISQFIVLALSFLSAFSIYLILQKIKGMNIKVRVVPKTLSLLFVVLLLTSAVLPNWPYATGDMNGAYSHVEMPDEFQQANQWLSSKEGDFKVLWIPSYSGRNVFWNKDHRTFRDIASLSSSQPTYHYDTANMEPNGYGIYYLESIISDLDPHSLLMANETVNLGKIIAPLGIRYLIFHNDNGTYVDPEKIINNIESQEDMQLIRSFGFIHIFENLAFTNSFKEHFSIWDRSSFFMGDMSSLSNLCSIDDFDPSKSGLIFGEQKGCDIEEFDELVDEIILTKGRVADDIPFTFIDEKYLLEPGKYAGSDSPDETWQGLDMKDIMTFRNQRWGGLKAWDWGYGATVAHTWNTGDFDEEMELGEHQLYHSLDMEDGTGLFSVQTDNITLENPERSTSGKFSLSGTLPIGSPLDDQIIVSDIMLIKEGSYRYRMAFDLECQDVFNFQFVVKLFDTDKNIIGREFLLSQGGSFNFKEFYDDMEFPSNTVYYQIKLKSNNDPYKESNWYLDNIRFYDLEELIVPNTLEFDFNVASSSEYDIFIRSHSGMKGGRFRIGIDETYKETIETYSEDSSFQWGFLTRKILEKGTHSINLDNLVGYNAVNLIAVIPSSELEVLRAELQSLLENKPITEIYTLSGEEKLDYGSPLKLHLDAPQTADYSLMVRSQDGRISGQLLLKSGSDRFQMLSGDEIGSNGMLQSDEFPSYVWKNETISTESWELEASMPFEEDWVHSHEYNGSWSQPLNETIINEASTKNYVHNCSFESGWNQSMFIPENWTAPANGFQVSLDTKNSTHGKNSLMITSNESFQGEWSSMEGQLPDLMENDTYVIGSDVRFVNTNKSHIKIQGYSEEANKWKDIGNLLTRSQGTGSSDWMELSKEFTVPLNISEIRMKLNAGSKLDPMGPDAVFWLDNISLYQNNVSIEVETIKFTAENDGSKHTQGAYSLMVTTDCTDPNKWSSMESYNIPVAGGADYLVDIDAKFSNTNKSFIKLQGLNSYSGEWEDIKSIVSREDGTGSGDWITYNKSFICPISVTHIRLKVNSGSVLDLQSGNATTWLDNFALEKHVLSTYQNPVLSLNYHSHAVGNDTSIKGISTWYYIPSVSLLQGANELDIESLPLGPFVFGSSFEDIAKGQAWTFNDGNELDITTSSQMSSKTVLPWSARLDHGNFTHGDHSLSLTGDRDGNDGEWSIITRDLLLDKAGDYYLSLDTRSTESGGIFARIAGFNISSSHWEELVIIQGSEGTPLEWRELSGGLFIPDHISRIKISLGMNASMDDNDDDFSIWFDSLRFNFLALNQDTSAFDMAILHSETDVRIPEDIFDHESLAEILYTEEISPLKYRLDITSGGPFILSLRHTYDEYWVARVEGGGDSESIAVQGMLNGFYINRTGNYTVTVEYLPQKWSVNGIYVTIIFVLALDICLLFCRFGPLGPCRIKKRKGV